MPSAPTPRSPRISARVLWAKGDRDGARSLWKVQLESNPDNAVLKETVERLAH